MAINSRPLCTNPHCAIPGRHGDECPGNNCRGCLPGLAADGLQLCTHHANRIADDAKFAATLYGELETPTSSGTGDHVSGSTEAPIPINPDAVEARTSIRATLASWCRLIADERNTDLPADTITGIATYISRHAEWLAAHPAAGDCSDELANIVRAAKRIARPSGTRTYVVAPCPAAADDGTPCSGKIKAVIRVIDSDLPSLLACDANPGHHWTADQWRAFGRAVLRVTTNAGTVNTLGLAVRLGCSVQYVQRLVADGIITSIGRIKSGRGRPTMAFDVATVEAELERHAERVRVPA